MDPPPGKPTAVAHEPVVDLGPDEIGSPPALESQECCCVGLIPTELTTRQAKRKWLLSLWRTWALWNNPWNLRSVVVQVESPLNPPPGKPTAAVAVAAEPVVGPAPDEIGSPLALESQELHSSFSL